MATARDLSYKIASLTNMQKVMNAMNMIASTKFRKLMMRMPAMEKFRNTVGIIRDDITSGLGSSTSAIIYQPEKVKNIHVIVFTADKGLCGSHNSSVLKALIKIFADENRKGVALDVTCIGARARNLCRKQNFKVCDEINSNEQHISDHALREIATKTIKRISEGEIDKVIIIHNHFVSTLLQQTKQLQIFPMLPNNNEKSGEPDKSRVELSLETEPKPADFIIPAATLYLYYSMKIALTDSYLSEHAARMTAMENAKTNAADLIKRYVKIRNRARQSTITKELIEIVAGKEAL
ncbi:MAG: ATP synthase F1 subunit gamma [Kiritimatiellae bacterium]|jgi:F-type H+-transporting ATPase subunit gamma|nr:ATP synthase F1 subunit gamma [Kiritimatiellia bacterium]